jgi:hypothetical protein
MQGDEKIGRAARLLAARYGPAAVEVARRHAAECNQRDNHESCREWLDVIAALLEITGNAPGTGHPEPPLEDVLHGSVTRQVMAADHVDREEVETVLADAARRRR